MPHTPSPLNFFEDAQAFEAFYPYTSYYRNLQHAVVESVQARPGDLILELGCATGDTSRALATRYPDTQVVGVDFRPERIEQAREDSPPADYPHLTFLAADTAQPETYLPWKKRYPDIICSLYGLHHIPDPYEGKLTFISQLYELPIPSLRLVFGDRTTQWEADEPDYEAATRSQWKAIAEEAYRSVFLNRYLECLNGGIQGAEARETAVLLGEYVRHLEYQRGNTVAIRQKEYPLSAQEMGQIWLEAGFSIEILMALTPFHDTLVVAAKG